MTRHKINITCIFLLIFISVFLYADNKSDSLEKFYVKSKDKVFSKVKDRQIAEIQTKYETQKKDYEVNNPGKPGKHQKILVLFFSIFSILILAAAFIFYIKNKIKKNSNKELINKNNKILEQHKKLEQVYEQLRVSQEKIIQNSKELIILNRKLLNSEKELKELNHTKDKLFSIIAHDMINPFNAIMGFSNILYEEYNELEDFEIKKYIKTIYDSTNNLYNLLQNLLQWSRSQIGKTEFKPCIFDLSDVVNNNIELLNISAERKGIKISSDIKKNSYAYFDKNMIDTVIRNLVSNAIKFTREGGEIKIFSVDKSNYVEVAVSDTGVGINDDDIKKLFSIDKNHTSLGTSKEKGTGLGLILCKEFVEKNGGKIYVESNHKGSTFKFTLPKNVKLA